jgi:hypothetical protein
MNSCLKVPENLEPAFQRLRLVNRCTILWGDMICFDQVDTVKCSQRVPILSATYGGAYSVGVWLGEKVNTSKKRRYHV